MSVRKGDQTSGDLQVIVASRKLIDYTYDRVHDKTLPKSDRWLICKSIWDAASTAHSSILGANAIRVETKSEAEERLLKEKIAIASLDSLNSWIDVLNIKGIVSDRQADFWTKLATTTQDLAKAWLKSNKQSYKKYFTENTQKGS